MDENRIFKKGGENHKQYNLIIKVLLGLMVIIFIFNQWQISAISDKIFISSIKNINPSELSQIKSTAHSIAALFPVERIKNSEDAIALMITQGTPEYGVTMGVTFDDPVGALSSLAGGYNAVKADIKQNNPEVWDRYLNLATKPVGISCEFCCGVGPIGITKSGDLKCGCSHNPAIQTLTMLLMKDTDYDDAEVLREAIKWKSVWFPRDMVGLAMEVSGGEIDTVLPGMVGGC